MDAQPRRSTPPPDAITRREVSAGASPDARRIFLHEPGWAVALKVGSERVFCYQMAPGQDYYHRLLDGEVYVFHGDEKLCLACAERRGLLAFEPKSLREQILVVELSSEADSEIEVLFPPDPPRPGEGRPAR